MGEGGTIWEDGLGRRDEDARVLCESRVPLTPDPQSVRFGDGAAEAAVQGVIGGPVFRGRPLVDLYLHEGLRPVYARLTPDQARALGRALEEAAERAEEAAGG